MSNIAALDNKLNQAIPSGTALEAFEELYADDVVMQENTDAPFVGKAFNRKREQEFFADIEQFHGAHVLAAAAAGDVSFSEWTMDVTFKGGTRVQMAQMSARRWKNGKVVHERCYYNKG